MIVAIVNQITPVGTQRVEEFREAVDENAAVNDFCNDHVPPDNPSDWLGFDTTWVSYQSPAAGMYWAFDFDNPGLVQLAENPEYTGLMALQIIQDAKSPPGGGSLLWQDMVYFSLDLSLFDPDVDALEFQIAGRYISTKNDPGTPQIRLLEDGLAVSAEINMPDTAGIVEDFTLTTDGFTLSGGLKTFLLQANTQGASNILQLQGVTAQLVKKVF